MKNGKGDIATTQLGARSDDGLVGRHDLSEVCGWVLSFEFQMIA